MLDLRHDGAVLALVSCQERGTIELLLECAGRAYRSNLKLFAIDIRGAEGHRTAQRECRSRLINRLELGIESESLRGAGNEPPTEPESGSA